jgi:hypothetical protein
VQWAGVVWPVQKGNNGILRYTGWVEMGNSGLGCNKEFQKIGNKHFHIFIHAKVG